MTTVILKVTPLDAARLEFAGQQLGMTRERVAHEAIRLFLRSMPTEPPKPKTKRRVK